MPATHLRAVNMAHESPRSSYFLKDKVVKKLVIRVSGSFPGTKSSRYTNLDFD